MQSEQRLAVLKKIEEYEKNGLWDKDVEDDPESIPLTPDKADYLLEKPFAKFKTYIANKVAVSYYEKLIKKGQFVIKDIKGFENFDSVSGGAVITCNHFSVCDNYAIYRAIRKRLGRRNLYKVIREGNYTNFKGLYGFFFRHCNTLPLSSDMQTMKKFFKSVDVLLKRGDKILIYPEQSMWWNYRKPRPMKNGAFRIAVRSNVPVIPAFITMEDTDALDSDGFKIQAYTIHFLKPIYPKDGLSEKQNSEMLKEENFKEWKEVYEDFYNTPLVYLKNDIKENENNGNADNGSETAK